jgi:hypothetical protein
MVAKNLFIKTYLNQEEYAILTSQARNAAMSNSKFLKRIALGYEVRSRVDQKAYLALLKSIADLGRLGGLLKCHLEASGVQSEATFKDWRNNLLSALSSIDMTQRKLTGDVREVGRQLLAVRKK